MEIRNKQYLLYGGSGHAKVISECIHANHGTVEGIFDDNPDFEIFGGFPFLGCYQKDKHIFPLIVSIGNNKIRKIIVEKLKNLFGTIIHTSACVSPNVEIGEGSVIFHNSILQVDCRIGKHVILNSGASVDHECLLSDFVHISPQATLCGNVVVGEGVHIGANAVVIPDITIGKWATIGAGAVILKDIPDFAVVVGNPGRIIRFNKSVCEMSHL